MMKGFQTSLLGDSDSILPKDEFQSVVAKSSISNQKPTVYSTMAESPLSNTPTPIYRHYRTIGEIRLYLEHFFIHLTTTEKLFCLLNPVSIIFNIVYIFYKFIKVNIEQSESSSSRSDSMVADAEMITCWVEFVGLLTLISLAGLFYRIDRLASTLDCLRLSGEWSSFKLIYCLRPKAIVQLLSGSFTNDIFDFQKGQEENDANLTKNLRKILRDLGSGSNNESIYDNNGFNLDSDKQNNVNDSRVKNFNNNSEQNTVNTDNDEYENKKNFNHDYYGVSDDNNDDNDNNNNNNKKVLV